jgi:hypothetical protein
MGIGASEPLSQTDELDVLAPINVGTTNESETRCALLYDMNTALKPAAK